MGSLIEAKNVITAFLKETTSSSDVTVIRLDRDPDGWKAVGEVYEDDSFLKSMNLPPKKARRFYAVSVDGDLEVTSYSRLASYSEGDSGED
ncbi:hypothetical protein EKD00_00585 [Chlorobium phaeovibrioides]|jgi:hypothetical protein|uniref:Gas vesicle synthesis family protein n=2 Tax=Chlorobium/Pelodictyon group TaxID=274493 RepID=Q3B501_CHLL3|nr:MULTISPECIES: gas vesicle protein GvpO [Chlorobium/Pelodictyon group]ABB23580.1 hypothetical protein Plut_0702 [Pelodictyon luteolum DSM 273]KAA6232438.1 hypothetical protein FP507_04575 [Chlorobium phaeovibrioides]MDT9546673.1 gas vesicle protein GvpO [Chlorobium phaeovibrioides]MWV55221.1 hypothetical protein [Chlorobium phaeovibrioides]QEQ56858.1 hypothetical protein FNV82_03975 [Chlorobium phaeovibrioides]